MKTATIPAVRVEPEFRQQVERLLAEGESLSEFVEAAVRASVRIRAEQGRFIARGLQSLAQAQASDAYLDADEVVARLKKKLDIARRPEPTTTLPPSRRASVSRRNTGSR